MPMVSAGRRCERADRRIRAANLKVAEVVRNACTASEREGLRVTVRKRAAEERITSNGYLLLPWRAWSWCCI